MNIPQSVSDSFVRFFSVLSNDSRFNTLSFDVCSSLKNIRGDIRIQRFSDSIGNEFDQNGFRSALRLTFDFVKRFPAKEKMPSKRSSFSDLPNGKIVAGFRESKKNSVSSASPGDYGVSMNGKPSDKNERFFPSGPIDRTFVDSGIVESQFNPPKHFPKRFTEDEANARSAIVKKHGLRGDAFDFTPRKIAEAKNR